ncbi:hypothetical protein FHU35_12451 [Saccharopolyspora dendranthemae]|uniref:Uncharacterized protein n=1 Tax=Saccharopolyspora dendranthemae TaxID=1181886 RepID=A0A561U7W9_9PSEU|nr:hypothetical protein FHU35_12451 [Saccharopolyspora dendranthemae]
MEGVLVANRGERLRPWSAAPAGTSPWRSPPSTSRVWWCSTNLRMMDDEARTAARSSSVDCRRDLRTGRPRSASGRVLAGRRRQRATSHFPLSTGRWAVTGSGRGTGPPSCRPGRSSSRPSCWGLPGTGDHPRSQRGAQAVRRRGEPALRRRSARCAAQHLRPGVPMSRPGAGGLRRGPRLRAARRQLDDEVLCGRASCALRFVLLLGEKRFSRCWRGMPAAGSRHLRSPPRPVGGTGGAAPGRSGRGWCCGRRARRPSTGGCASRR